jgi:NDP-sugar pyrophosphorylase family protein
MCVKTHNYQVPFASVTTDGGDTIVKLQENPTYSFMVNAGIYILNPEVKSFLPQERYFDMPDLFNIMIEKKMHVRVFKHDDYWLDIGREEDYHKANKDIAR